MAFKGSSSEGDKYKSTADMWQHELKGDLDDKESGWYGKAIAYWEKIPATIDGVLGGLAQVHPGDIKESAEVIRSFTTMGRQRALDCGAGIGRLTGTLLLPLGFEKVDLLEPVEHMMAKAGETLPADRIGEKYVTSMQKLEFTQKYDVVLIQWAAIYLTDDDFATFLARCKQSLLPGGIIFFKENCSLSQEFVVDKDDSSLTRSDLHYKAIFAKAGVEVVKEQLQQDWPKGLFPVKMYCLQ